MTGLVQSASVQPKDSGFARLAYADRLGRYFTTNAVLHLEPIAAEFPVINGKTELVQAAMAARTQLRQAQFQLADLDVTFPADHHTANAYVVVTGQINFQTNAFGQAFRMVLRKSNGGWLISEVNAVERMP